DCADGASGIAVGAVVTGRPMLRQTSCGSGPFCVGCRQAQPPPPCSLEDVEPDHLSHVDLLATLPVETLAQLARRMTREEIPSGAGVCAEGDEGDRFYVVLE